MQPPWSMRSSSSWHRRGTAPTPLFGGSPRPASSALRLGFQCSPCSSDRASCSLGWGSASPRAGGPDRAICGDGRPTLPAPPRLHLERDLFALCGSVARTQERSSTIASRSMVIPSTLHNPPPSNIPAYMVRIFCLSWTWHLIP
jgi:hypothetical protein